MFPSNVVNIYRHTSFDNVLHKSIHTKLQGFDNVPHESGIYTQGFHNVHHKSSKNIRGSDNVPHKSGKCLRVFDNVHHK